MNTCYSGQSSSEAHKCRASDQHFRKTRGSTEQSARHVGVHTRISHDARASAPRTYALGIAWPHNTALNDIAWHAGES